MGNLEKLFMNGKTLCLIISALVAGILFGKCDFASEWMSLIPLGGAIFLILLCIVYKQRNIFTVYSSVNEIIGMLIFLGIGNFTSVIHQPANTAFNKGSYEFRGKILDYTPTNSGDRLLISLSHLDLILNNTKKQKIDSKNVRALITIPEATNLTYGDIAYGIADLSPVNAPSDYLNNDYIAYLEGKNIFLKGFATPGVEIRESGGSLNAWTLGLREKLEAFIESTTLSVNSKSFLISVLLGDKNYITNEDRILFSDCGISHIFAVSGFHVGIIATFIIGILSLLFRGKYRRIIYALCLPFIWFYILLVGASPATCRAGIMISISMMALFLERKTKPLYALGWAVILILAFYPSALFDIGFQMSVVCVGSLLLIVGPISFISHRNHPVIYRLVSIILVTLIATLSTWIICAFYFHKYTLSFLPLNLIAVPHLPLYIALAVVYFLLFMIGIDLPFLSKSIGFLYDKFHDGAVEISNLSSPIENVHPQLISVVLWIIGIATLSYVLNNKNQWKSIWLPLSAFALSIFTLIYYPVDLPEGFIIQKNNKETSLMSYSNGKEAYVVLPEESSFSTINNKNIITLKSERLSPEILRSLPSADYILICNGCKSVPREVDKYRNKKSQLVIHPSLHWRYEKKIIAYALEKEIPVHSIRYDGPLHVFNN